MFADLQCGDAGRALDAVEHAMRAFVPVSAATPLSGWPAGFWALLVAQPLLSGGEGGVPELAHLGSGPRAALLLRLVGGLDHAHAAQVFGVSEPTYRFALQRALQQLGDADVSYAALGRLRERLHRQVKTLDPARAETLAAIRARVLAGDPAPAPAACPDASGPRWPRRLAWALLAVLALAFAATWWPVVPRLAPGGVQDLPAETPAAPAQPPVAADADAGRIIHPDYAALADPAADALAADLPFLSWFANQDGPAAPANPADGPVANEAAAPPPAPAAEDRPQFQDLSAAERPLLVQVAPAWPSLDPGTRRQLLGQARHWLALDAAARDGLRARLDAWDALVPAERARRRGALSAWQALSPAEQARVAASAAAWRGLDPAAQAQWRERFEALPADQREPWWLGPALGDWFSPVQPLFAYVPEAERGALLDLLRGLPETTRDDLATLARRLPAAEREQLRRALLEAPPEAREALVRERLAQ